MAAKLSTEQLREAEIAVEQRHVDRVYARLEILTGRAEDLAKEGFGRASTMAQLGGVREEHSTGLFERDVFVQHALQRVAVLDAQHEGLVFGRLDRHDGDVHYIGRIGVRDEEHEPLVLDWRAPAASDFYRATAVEPLGVIRRRVLRCRGERVIGVEDDLLDADAAPSDLPVLGEGALMAALTDARGPVMRDIVATIQREQDEIIRSPARGATLIGGGPGTGKTVVALHRAAYLLYADRRRMEFGGVLIIGPSNVFMDYIERVLPSLGETSASLRALGEVVDGVRTDRHDPPDCAAVKGSSRMRRLLARAVRDAVPGAPGELAVFAGDRTLRLDAAALGRIRADVLRRGTRRNRGRPDAMRAVTAALWQQVDETTKERVEFEDFVGEVREHGTVQRFMEQWWPILTPEQVLGWLADPERLARYAGRVLRAGEAELLLASWKDRDTSGPSVEDVPLLDELGVLLGSPPPEARERGDDEVEELTTVTDREYSTPEAPEDNELYDGYAHVLVDEAQDLSPMQWRMLGRRGKTASWTIVGDPAQSAWPDAEESARAMEEALGTRARRRYELTTNYRNSAEIFEFAGSVIRRELPDLELPNAVRRTGSPPRELVVSAGERGPATVRTLAELLATVEGTVAVIVPEQRRGEALGWVAGVDGADDRVSVTTGVGAKGLEYDGVVVVEPDEIIADSQTGIRTLYVALTRATQLLITITEDATR